MVVGATGNGFGKALAATLRARGLEPADLARAVGVRPREVTDWILGDCEPKPALVFRVEEVLDVHAGLLSRLLGYLPMGAAATTVSVEVVVRQCDLLDEDGKRLVLAVWNELVKRNRRAPGLRAVGPPRAGRQPGIALVEHRRDFQCELRDRGRAESTIRHYLATVEKFYRYLCRNGRPGTDRAVRPQDVEGYLEEVGRSTTRVGVTARRRALREFFQWLVDEGDLGSSPMASVGAGASDP